MTFDEIKKHLEEKVEEVLKKEVLEAVRVVEAEAIDDIVYSVYPQPKMYDRRFAGSEFGGGLKNPENMLGDVKNGVLTVTNITPPHPVYSWTMGPDDQIAEVIEYGSGYKGYYYDYPVPRQVYGRRPFTRATAYRLYRDKDHVNALRKGLKFRGFDVT